MRKKILVIEDNPEVRENTAEILELSNYEVFTAENGKVGVEKALQSAPDLIICDVMMPLLDGFGVLHILSKKPATSDIPFIFLTAKADKADFRKGMNLGADDYITKPFDDVELLDAIEIRLKKSERIRAAFDGTAEGLSSFINEAKGQQELEKLSQDREIRTYKKKEFIYQEGDLPRQVYFINKGKIKVFRTNDAGKEFITQIHQAGDFIAHAALLKEGVYNESAVAIEESELSLIPKKDFLALLYNNKDFSACFVKMLARDVEEKEQELLELAYNSIRKRVAQALMKLHRKTEEDNSITILRDDLAGIVGTAKESVIRTLGDFKSEGLISIESGKVIILKPQALEELPN